MDPIRNFAGINFQYQSFLQGISFVIAKKTLNINIIIDIRDEVLTSVTQSIDTLNMVLISGLNKATLGDRRVPISFMVCRQGCRMRAIE